jgi:putative tricarboxylic transport membrane protein
MATPTRNNGDLISGAVLAGLGVFIIVEARGWDYLAPDGPGPGFFPIWYGIALVALSLFLVAVSLKRTDTDRGTPVDWREVGRALISWAALTACIALLKVLGFVASFALLTLFVVSVMYRRPLVHGVAAAVLASAGFYLLFPFALNVTLPVGVLGF